MKFHNVIESGGCCKVAIVAVAVNKLFAAKLNAISVISIFSLSIFHIDCSISSPRSLPLSSLTHEVK